MTDIVLHTRKWIHYDNPDAPVVLLIHGLASSSLTWKHVARDLYSKGYNVYAPDLLGHGHSPRLTTYSVQQWADSIREAGIPTPHLILGHSIGGLVAAKLQEALKATHLALIDPVFRLPKQTLLLKMVQYFFIRTIVYQTLVSHQVGVKRNRVVRQLKLEWLRHKMWDRATVKALTPDPKIIVNRILSGTENILILRASNSYIVPRTVTQRTFRENVKVVNIKGGHNFYGKHHNVFVAELLLFLEGTKNDRQVVPATVEMQTM